MSSNRKRKRSASYQDLQKPTDIPLLKAYFQMHSVDVDASCTAAQESANASADRTAKRCWISERLSLWNNILHNVGLELREHSTGKLTLQTSVVCTSSTEFRVVSVFLLKRLLSDHHCVERLDLRHFGELFGNERQLLNQIALSSGVQQVNIDCRQTSKKEAGELVRFVLRGKPLQIALRSIFWSPDQMTALVRNIKTTGTRLADLDLSDSGLKGCDCIRLIEVIEACTALKCLRLDSNIIGLRGAQRFAKLLSTNDTLTRVSLFKTNLKDKGAAAIGDALASNKTLTYLMLGANSIGWSGAKTIASSLSVNTALVHLDLRHNNLENSGAVFFAQSLQSNQTLQELHLCRNGITDDGVVAIAGSLTNQRTLQCLAINENHFGENGIEAIARLVTTNKTLTHLNIISTRNLSSAVEFKHFAKALARSRTLQSIELRVWCSATMATLSRALRSHGTLLKLSIRTFVTDMRVLFRALANNRSIQSLELHGILSTENVEGLTNLLSKTRTLRSVTISQRVSNTSLMQLVYGLVGNASIWKFRIRSQKLGVSACRSIAAMLTINRTLRYLDLDGAPTTNEAGLESLAESLAYNRSLQQLRVVYSDSSAAGFQVSESLRRNGDAFCRVIQFALGNVTDRDSAAAFQQHQRSEFLKRELSLLPEVSSPSAAMCLIRKASNYIREHYFVVAGIVKSSVQCPKPTQTRGKPAMQFDELNADCMFHIASFLKVADVKYP